MGNIISASSTAADHLIPTRRTRPQHLQQELEAGITAKDNNSTGEDPNLQYELTTSINESRPNTRDEEDPSVEGNNIGNGNTSNGHISDPRIIGRTTARLHDPKGASYLLRYYLPLWAVVCVKLTGGNPMLLSNIAISPFMIFSLVAFCMALLILSLLSWMFEHSEENYSSPRSTRYKILIGLYYIFGNLAYFSLLPVLFTGHQLTS